MPARTFFSTRHHRSRSRSRAWPAAKLVEDDPAFFQTRCRGRRNNGLRGSAGSAGRTVLRPGPPRDEATGERMTSTTAAKTPYRGQALAARRMKRS